MAKGVSAHGGNSFCLLSTSPSARSTLTKSAKGHPEGRRIKESIRYLKSGLATQSLSCKSALRISPYASGSKAREILCVNKSV